MNAMKHGLLALALASCAKDPAPAPTAKPTAPAAANDHQLHRTDTADSISITGQGVPLASQPTADWIGLPMSGDMDVSIDIKGTSDLTKANGKILITCTTCRLGDGKTKIKPQPKNQRAAAFAGDGIDFGHVELGNASIAIAIKDGTATITTWNVTSNEATLSVSGTMTFGKTLAESTIDACVRFNATDALRQREPMTHAALQVTGAPMAADGMFNIKLTGTVGQMRRLGMVCDGTAPPPTQDAQTRPTLPDPADTADAEPDQETVQKILAGIKKKNDTTYEIERAQWDKLVGTTTALAKGARVVPAIRNGKPIGFKIFGITPTSIYAKLGFLNGDTIQTIAGIDLTTADKALEVYAKIRESMVDTKTVVVIVVAIERRGKQVTMTYTVK